MDQKQGLHLILLHIPIKNVVVLLNSLSALTCAKIKMSKNENDPTVVTENNLVLSKVENASADCEDDSIRLQKRTRIRSIFSMLSGKDI